MGHRYLTRATDAAHGLSIEIGSPGPPHSDDIDARYQPKEERIDPLGWLLARYTYWVLVYWCIGVLVHMKDVPPSEPGFFSIDILLL